MTELEQDRRDLKVVAFKQRIAEIVVDYEDKDAERRIHITELTKRIQQLEQENLELRESQNVQEEEQHLTPTAD